MGKINTLNYMFLYYCLFCIRVNPMLLARVVLWNQSYKSTKLIDFSNLKIGKYVTSWLECFA